MEVLITGGAGFVGCNLANHFANKGHKITVYDNLSRKMTKTNLDWLQKNYKGKISYISADIRDFEMIKKAARDADVIIHTAAQVAVTTSLDNPREDFEINALGTFNMLEAARLSKNNPKIVFFSTNKVYGNNVNKIPVKELDTRYTFDDKKYEHGIPEDFSTDAEEHSPYGVSKYSADMYTRDYAHTYGLHTTVFRCSCMYGTRQFGNEDQGWVAHFVISSILGRPLTIYGDGKQVRDLLFIDDLVMLVEAAITKSKKGDVFNIGGGSDNTLSLLELLAILDKKLGKKSKPAFSGWRTADQKVYISDIRKAQKVLGWKPSVGPEEGIGRLIAWVKDNMKLIH